jgi:hypothetical protein
LLAQESFRLISPCSLSALIAGSDPRFALTVRLNDNEYPLLFFVEIFGEILFFEMFYGSLSDLSIAT